MLQSAGAAAQAAVPEVSVTHRWSGQVIETNDGLPYIGETAERQFVATGFAGNGMTFGTLSAMMFADHVTGQANPWAELFDPGRTKIKGGLWDYIKENKDYPYYIVRDRFAGKGGQSLRAVKRGTGEVIDVDGHAGRRLPRAGRRDSRALSRLHAHGLLRALERRRTHVGLPLPRIALQGRWRGARWPRRKAAGTNSSQREGRGSKQGLGIGD